MIGSVFFIFNRLVEIVFLIPIIGMLVCHTHTHFLSLCPEGSDKDTDATGFQAWFVHGFLKANMLTPSFILVLFIVSVIAIFWAIDTVIRFSSTKRSAIFVSFMDLCFFGAFIAGVYQLRFIANADCSNWNGGEVFVSLGPFGSYGLQIHSPLSLNLNKTCAMLKTSFALGIMEVAFFFWTALLALFIHQKNREVVVKETTVRRRSHSSRRGHSGSRHRHHSSSRRPQYVV